MPAPPQHRPVPSPASTSRSLSPTNSPGDPSSAEPDSEADTTSFFSRPQEVTIPRSGNRRNYGSQERVQRGAEVDSRDEHDETASSSDLEILDESDRERGRGGNKQETLIRNQKQKKRKRPNIQEKGKSKTVERSRPSTLPGGDGYRRTGAAGALSDSDSDLEPLYPIEATYVSSTQIERHGDALRDIAREQGNWKGSTPPARVAKKRLQQEEQGSSRTRMSGSNTNKSTSPFSDRDGEETLSRKVRRTSDSTNATSLSSDPPYRPRPKPTATTSKAKTKTRNALTADHSERQRKSNTRPHLSRSPSPQLEPLVPPPPPKSFWGIDTQVAQASMSKTKQQKAKIGEKSAKLKSLSEQRPKIIDFGDHPVDEREEDDITDGSSNGSDAGGARRYESVAKKAQRERLEAMERLKASRNGTGTRAGGGTSTTTEARLSPLGLITKSNSTRKQPRSTTSTSSCPVCTETVPTQRLKSHMEQCVPHFDELDTDDYGGDLDRLRTTRRIVAGSSNLGPRPNSTRPNATPSRARNSETSRSTPTGGGHRCDVDNLALELFPSQEDGRRPAEELDEDDVPIPMPAAKSRGYGHGAKDLRNNGITSSKGEDWGQPKNAEDQEDEYSYGDDGFDDEGEDWEMLDEIERNACVTKGGGGASLHKTVINIDDDNEDDDLIIEESGPSLTQQTRAAAGGGPGFLGRVNSKRVPGPPKDGSPPPKGSLYLSTMSRAWKEGYERMYARASGHKDAEEAGSAEFDPMRVQKMTTAAPTGRGGRGGGRRGRGGFRGRSRGGRKRN